VRARMSATLSLAAIAALALAGCSGTSTPDDASTPSASAGADLCAAAAPSGAASDGVTVEGDEGTAPTVTFTSPLEISEVERTVVSEGDGDAVQDGDLISYALSAYDASTGEQLGTLGYAEGELLPQPLTADSVLGSFFGCATVGSRVVTTLPATDSNPSAAVYVLDLLDVTPLQAWGEDQEPAEGLPTVELGDDGAPTITIPEGDAPTDLQLETLKLGDGPVVQPGDTVLVQYRGVKWSDGEEFDSTWSKGGQPTSFATTGVVDGFRQALEGQTVGSQVLVVIPPALGYGSSEGNELQNETLVFVVDILATQHAAAAPTE
jgi:hypothetical protein